MRSLFALSLFIINTIWCQATTVDISISPKTSQTEFLPSGEMSLESQCLTMYPSDININATNTSYFYYFMTSADTLHLTTFTFDAQTVPSDQISSKDFNVRAAKYPGYTLEPSYGSGSVIRSIDWALSSLDGDIFFIQARDTAETQLIIYNPVSIGGFAQPLEMQGEQVQIVEISPNMKHLFNLEEAFIIGYVQINNDMIYCISFYEPKDDFIADWACSTSYNVAGRIDHFQIIWLNSTYYAINYDINGTSIGSDILSNTQKHSSNILAPTTLKYNPIAATMRFHDSLPILNHLQTALTLYIMVSSHYVANQLQLVFDLRYLRISSDAVFGSISVTATNFPYLYALSTANALIINDVIKLVDVSISDGSYDYETDTGCDVFGLYYPEIPSVPINSTKTYPLYLRLFEVCIINIGALQFKFNWITDDYQINTASSKTSAKRISITSNTAGNIVMAGWIESGKGSGGFAVYARLLEITVNKLTNDTMQIIDISGVTNTGLSGVSSCDIKSPLTTTTVPYFYIGGTGGSALYGGQIDMNGNIVSATDSYNDELNNPGKFPDAELFDYQQTNIEDLSMYINTNSKAVIYAFRSSTNNGITVFQYTAANKSEYGTGWGTGTGPSLIEDAAGRYLHFDVNAAASPTQYEISRHGSIISGQDQWTDTLSEATNVVDPVRVIKLEDMFYILFYVADTSVRCDIFIWVPGGTDTQIKQLLTPSKVIYASSSDTPMAHDIKPLFVDIDLPSNDINLYNVANNKSFLVTYTRTSSAYLQIVFDLLYIKYNETKQIATWDRINYCNLPMSLDILPHTATMIKNGVKLFDIKSQNDYEQNTGCDVMGVYYWSEDSLYLRPFEICIDITNGNGSASCAFNWLTNNPHTVDLQSGDEVKSYGLAIDTDFNGNIVMAAWIRGVQNTVSLLMIRSFRMDIVTSAPTATPTATPTVTIQPTMAPSRSPTSPPTLKPTFSNTLQANITSISGSVIVRVGGIMASKFGPQQCFITSPIDGKVQSLSPYWYIGASIDLSLYGSTINLYGNTTNSNINDFNDPNLWPEPLSNIQSSINNDLIMHVNSATNSVVYLFSQSDNNVTWAFEIAPNSTSQQSQTAFAAGYNPQIQQTTAGYIIIYINKTSKGYGVALHGASITGQGGTVAISTRQAIDPPHLIKIEDRYFPIYYSVQGKEIYCDIYYFYYQGGNAIYELSIPNKSIASLTPNDQYSDLMAHDIQPLFSNITLSSIDDNLLSQISDRAFIVTYTRIYKTNTLQIVLDVLYLDFNVVSSTRANGTWGKIGDWNNCDFPVFIELGDTAMIENGVKLVDITLANGDYVDHEQTNLCDIMAVYYWLDESIYLRPFEVCADITNGIATASCSFNWLSDDPLEVNSEEKNNYVTAYGLSIDTDMTGEYLMAAWIQRDNLGGNSIFTSTFNFDLFDQSITKQPVTTSTEQPLTSESTQTTASQSTQTTKISSTISTTVVSKSTDIDGSSTATTTATQSSDTSITTENTEADAGNVEDSNGGFFNDILNDTGLLIIVLILMLLLFITFLGFLHKLRGRLLPCFWPSDDAQIAALIIYALQVWDFFSDGKFSYELFQEYGNDNKKNLLFELSLLFLALPWLFNVIFLFYERRKWIRHAIVNAWVRDYAALLMFLTMISGGANAVIELCNSRLFGLKIFQMNLPRHEYLKLSKYPVLMCTIFENIPQIIIQYLYLTSSSNHESNAASSAMFALISSSLALLFSFGILILRCTDPLDDIPFCIVCKLDKNEDIKAIQKNLGYRIKIRRHIAQSLEIGDDLIKVDKVTIGVSKLLIYLSITSPVKDQKMKQNNFVKRRDTALKKMKSEYNHDIDEENVDLWLTKLLNAKSNGSLANNLKKCIKLQYMPIIDNVYHDDDNDLVKHMQLQQIEVATPSTINNNNKSINLNETEINIQMGPILNNIHGDDHEIVNIEHNTYENNNILSVELPKPVSIIPNTPITIGNNMNNDHDDDTSSSSGDSDDQIINININTIDKGGGGERYKD